MAEQSKGLGSHLADFNAVNKQAELQRMTGDPTVMVGVFVGTTLVYAIPGGKVGMLLNAAKDVSLSGHYLVQYRRGRLIGPDGRKGVPFDYGPYPVKHYDRERIAEMLRRHKEAA